MKINLVNNLRKTGSCVLKILVFSFVFAYFSAPAFSAIFKKKNSSDNSKNQVEISAEEVVVLETSVDASAVTSTSSNDSEKSIKLPSAKPRTYFSKIDEQVLHNIENGSPESLAKAVAAFPKFENDLTEPEKVLLNIAVEMNRLLWPSEKTNWNTYSVAEENAYTGALNSVEKGVYDTSTGNVDFLSTFIPALVLLIPNISVNVQNQCEQGILQALQINPDSVAANYLAGIFYTKASDFVKAEAYLEKAYEASKVVEISIEYAKVLSKNGKTAQAQMVMNNVQSDENSSILILKQNAYIAFEAGDYATAEDCVARVLQQTPNDLEFVLFRARIYIEKNDYIHGVSLLDVYARQDDRSADYLILRSRVQLEWSKNTAAATETIEKALQYYPDNVDALMIAAKISSMTDGPVAGKYADELASLVLEKNPSDKVALVYALDGLVQRENWKEAYDISKSLLDANMDNEDLVLKHVSVCIKLGKSSEANEIAEKAYKNNPASESIAQAYVLASTNALSREESLKLIDSMMNGSSSKMKSYLYYRKSFLERSEDVALADLRSSLIANPRNSDALFRLYEIYYDKSDYRKAQYYLRQVVAINPNDSSVRKLNEALTQLMQ